MNRSSGRLYQSVCDNATVEEVLQCINNATYSLTELVKMVTRDLSTGPGPQSLMDEQNWISDVTLTDYGRKVMYFSTRPVNFPQSKITKRQITRCIAAEVQRVWRKKSS